MSNLWILKIQGTFRFSPRENIFGYRSSLIYKNYYVKNEIGKVLPITIIFGHWLLCHLQYNKPIGYFDLCWSNYSSWRYLKFEFLPLFHYLKPIYDKKFSKLRKAESSSVFEKRSLYKVDEIIKNQSMTDKHRFSRFFFFGIIMTLSGHFHGQKSFFLYCS